MHRVEAEFDAKLKELEAKHQQEIAELSLSGAAPAPTLEESSETAKPDVTNTAVVTTEEESPPQKNPEEEERERKQAKARRKRDKAKEKERELELQIERENAEAGPSMRQVEVEHIQGQLTPLGLKIAEIASDGNCLYRAVAASLDNNSSYQETRTLCADALLEKEDEFAPFCEYDDKSPDFAGYVERVRNSSDWGGHLELRALSVALQKHIIVYSLQSREPLHIRPEDSTTTEDANPVRLSYHLHYYALGEHYNQVVKAEAS